MCKGKGITLVHLHLIFTKKNESFKKLLAKRCKIKQKGFHTVIWEKAKCARGSTPTTKLTEYTLLL